MTTQVLIWITLIVLIVGGIFSKALAAHLFRKRNHNHPRTWAEWWDGISTELFGAVITTILFTVLIGNFEAAEAKQERTAQLVAQMASPNNEFALEATRQLRYLGWLDDDVMIGANLWGANLRDANLSDVNFQDVSLTDADLRRAYFGGANLYGVDFQNANLQNAGLEWVDMGDTLLVGASLKGVNFHEAQFDDQTWLPDETFWTPETDMARFTDPDHPDFWEPVWAAEGYDSWLAWKEDDLRDNP